MDHVDAIVAAIAVVLGPGGYMAIRTARTQKRKGSDDPLPVDEVRTAEITRAAESIDLDARWKGYVDDMRAYFGAEISGLKADRDADRQRIVALELTASTQMSYIYVLRSHIDTGRPPPSPAWPEAIDPTRSH